MSGTAKPAPPEAPRGKTRDELLAAASSLMRERDNLEVSLSEIAQRANANAALVKYYFGNKEGLLLALLERDAIQGLTEVARLLEMPVRPTAKIKIHLSGVINTYFRIPYLNRLLLAMIRDSAPERASEITDRYVRPLIDAYAQIIGEGVQAGEFKPVDPTWFYLTAIGACDQLFSARGVVQQVVGTDGVTEEVKRKFSDHTRRLLLSGLLANPESDA